jgi:predicted dehydrogenase
MDKSVDCQHRSPSRAGARWPGCFTVGRSAILTTVRVGFIGAGFIATYHSKSLKRSGVTIERAGVYDIDTAKAERFAAASGHHVCQSADEVIDTCDVVYICTWTSEHLALVKAAAAKGCAIFCEKPLAPTLSEAQALVDVIEAAGVINQVGLVLRHSPAMLMAHHLINEPIAGPLLGVVLRDDQFIPIQGHYDSTWRADRTKAGSGTLLEHSIHDIDVLEWLCGPIATVSAHATYQHGLVGIEDGVAVSFSTGGPGPKAIGTLCSLWHDNMARPSLRHLELFCAHRSVTIDGDDWFGSICWTHTDGTTHQLQGDALVSATESMLDGPANPDGAFIAAVAAGTRAFPDVRTALRAHQVVDACYRSIADNSRAVQCPT